MSNRPTRPSTGIGGPEYRRGRHARRGHIGFKAASQAMVKVVDGIEALHATVRFELASASDVAETCWRWVW